MDQPIKKRKKYKPRIVMQLGATVYETYEKELLYLTRKSQREHQGYLPTLEEIEELKWQIREENREREESEQVIRDQISVHKRQHYRTYTLNMAETGNRRGIIID